MVLVNGNGDVLPDIVEDPSVPVARPYGPLERKRYPGRGHVTDRRTALEWRADQAWRDTAQEERRFPCLNPYIIPVIGLPSAVDGIAKRWDAEQPPSGRVPVEMQSRCRKCENCLAHRRRLWAARGRAEIDAAPRTWFGTFTMHPEARFAIQMRALDRLHRSGHGLEWHALPRDVRFKALADVASHEVTLWLKRVRKQSGARLRYLLVTESHKDGFPHFHMLLHEYDGSATKRLLESQWRCGFSQWRVVRPDDRKASFYVAKYLAKSALTRVRASQRYGQAQLVATKLAAMQKVTRLVTDGSPPACPLSARKRGRACF